MACYFQNIKIVEGNAFAILLPLVARYYTIEGRPNDEDIDCTQLENCKVMIGNTEYAATLTTDGVVIRDEGTLARGTYDIVLTATYQGYALRADWYEGVTIVKYNHQSNAEQYIQGSPIVMRPAFCIMALGDTELQNLKERLQQKIAETEQAKEAYEQAKADYDAKAEALDDVAQQSTLTQGVQDIRSDISHIDIDTSELAKETTAQAAKEAALAAKAAAEAINVPSDVARQGTNNNATNTVIYNKLQAIESSHILTYQINGITFSGGYVPVSVADILLNISNIESIEDDTIGYLGLVNTQQTFTGLKSISLPNVTAETTVENLSRSNTLERINLPNLNQTNYNFCVSNTALKYCNLLNVNIVSATLFLYATRLIDLIIGAGFTGNISLTYWSPSEALLSSSTSLLTQEDLDAGFTSNLQKLLYNIREHFAANLPDRTGQTSFTLTLHANMKAAIQADTATANAFTNKNWVIA